MQGQHQYSSQIRCQLTPAKIFSRNIIEKSNTTAKNMLFQALIHSIVDKVMLSCVQMSTSKAININPYTAISSDTPCKYVVSSHQKGQSWMQKQAIWQGTEVTSGTSTIIETVGSPALKRNWKADPRSPWCDGGYRHNRTFIQKFYSRRLTWRHHICKKIVQDQIRQNRS